MNNCNVLIIGFGKMGRIHAKHLTELKVQWKSFDIASDSERPEVRDFSHIIIATPIETHASVFYSLSDFQGRILIEKPVVDKLEDLQILRDSRVFCGMSERFNSYVRDFERFQGSMLHTKCSFIFSRGSSSTLLDVGIHDVDLFCHFHGLSGEPTEQMHFSQLGDRLFNLQVSSTCEAYFQLPLENNQRVMSVFTEQDSVAVNLKYSVSPPILNELVSFLSGEPCDALLAHSLILNFLVSKNQA